MTLDRGVISDVAASTCQVVGWCDSPSQQHTCQTPTGPNAVYRATSVVNRIELSIENVTQVDVTFSTLLSASAPLPLAIQLPMGEDTWIGIGNVCAGNLLRWQPNNASDYADIDFQWLYELVDPADKPQGLEHVPIMAQLESPTDSSEQPEDVLKDLETGGGGGMGCECNGIVAGMAS